MTDLPRYTISEPDWSLVPVHMRGALQRYVELGIEPGSFLAAVLCNDFKGAAGRADPINARRLKDWAIFLANYVPSACQGSPEHYEAWVKAGGLKGMEEARRE